MQLLSTYHAKCSLRRKEVSLPGVTKALYYENLPLHNAYGFGRLIVRDQLLEFDHIRIIAPCEDSK